MKKSFISLALGLAAMAAQADVVTASATFTFGNNTNPDAGVIAAPFPNGSASVTYQSPFGNSSVISSITDWSVAALGQTFTPANSVILSLFPNSILIGNRADAANRLPSFEAALLSYSAAAQSFTLDYNLVCAGCALNEIPFYRSTVAAELSIISQPIENVPVPAPIALVALGGVLFGLRSLRRRSV